MNEIAKGLSGGSNSRPIIHKILHTHCMFDCRKTPKTLSHLKTTTAKCCFLLTFSRAYYDVAIGWGRPNLCGWP